MNDSFLFDCAVKLCSSDHISGFVSANPVIDVREKITEQRLSFLYQLVRKVSDKVQENYINEGSDKIEYCFDKAIQLTCSDISCGVIAVEPILYERDQKICEVIEFYFSMIYNTLSEFSISLPEKDISNSVIDSISGNTNPTIEYKTIVIPIYRKMKKAKIKKGKR